MAPHIRAIVEDDDPLLIWVGEKDGNVANSIIFELLEEKVQENGDLISKEEIPTTQKLKKELKRKRVTSGNKALVESVSASEAASKETENELQS